MKLSPHGFANIMVLSLLPILISVTTVISYAAIVSLKLNKTKHLCLKFSLQQQIHSLESIQKLTSLNPWARSLRKQFKLAQKGLKAAIASANPPAIAAAEAYYAFVIAQQFSLKTYQQAILAEHSIGSNVRYASYRGSLQKEILGVSSISKIGQWNLALKMSPRNSKSPSYTARKSFSKKQAAGLMIQLDPITTFDRRIVFKGFNINCGSTINKSELSWRVVPLENKYL